MNRFKIVEKLGKGTFSTVYKALDTRTGHVCAVKVCDADPCELPGLLTEALVLLKFNHRNVVRCHEILFESPTDTSVSKIIFKLELMDADLETLLSQHTSLSIKKAILQLAEGLRYIHNLGVCHCDLKPANIMYSSKTKSLKITDFNSANIGKLRTTAGTTRWYASPESIESEMYSDKTDVWSLGCIFYELLTGDVLFPSRDETEHLLMIADKLGSEHVKPELFPYIADRQSVDLLINMLNTEPKKRYSINNVLNHPYLAFN
jgi:serine/threonine protein kinase